MHERTVSRVHQADDRMIDRARKQAAFHEALVRTIDVRDDGNLWQRIGQREFIFRHEDPDVALHLAAGKARTTTRSRSNFCVGSSDGM